jgi:DNA invertase Pin-like site-specific DNA recombinase
VDLLKAYSNHADQTKRLRSLLDLPRSRPPRQPRPPKQENHRLSAEQVAQLVAAYQAGGKVTQLARQFGVHRFTVYRLLKQAGVLRARGIQVEDLPDVVRLYEAGWSPARLADEYGVVVSTVASTLRKAGVTIRPRPGWPPQ